MLTKVMSRCHANYVNNYVMMVRRTIAMCANDWPGCRHVV
jgi:hypothetical protein